MYFSLSLNIIFNTIEFVPDYLRLSLMKEYC